MRIAIITASYPAFLRELYLNALGLEGKSYSEQLAARNESLFGFADFYSRGFKAQGHEAAEFHLNNPWLQYAWARERGMAVPQPGPPSARPAPRSRFGEAINGVVRPLLRRFVEPRPPAWQIAVLRAQIEAFGPDIIYNQEPAALRSGLLRSFRAPGRHIVGQIASALPIGENFHAYDLMVSSLPNFVGDFRARGVPAAGNRLAFESTVLGRIKTPLARDIDVSFVGNLSPDHPGRIVLLEQLAQRVPLKMWGNGIAHISSLSPLHRCYQGEAWGRAMYEVLGQSKIALNFHAAFSGSHANNLRLYEATGMGAMLLTDRKDDLGEIFVPGEEVVTYNTPNECASQIAQLLADDTRRAHIAAAGQRRTLDMHNYSQRTEALLAIFQDVIAGRARQRWLLEAATA